jgi:hypothetical protein
MSDPKPLWHRARIREELSLLASAEEQLKYEATVPHVNITAELLCGWFDDSYYPDDPGFISCFSTSELEALAEFNRYFDARTDGLPESMGTVNTWLMHPAWQEVMRAAARTLSLVAP